MSRAVAVARSASLPRTLVTLLSLALAALLLLAFLPATSHAQLGGLAKKARQAALPKGEKPAADTPARSNAPAITTASVASFINGLKAEQQVADSGRAAAQAAKTKYDANSQGVMQNWMDKSQKYDECTDQHTDNDPRVAQRNKLQASAGVARYKGETKKADSLDAIREKMDAQIIADAEKACEKLKTTPEELQKTMMNQPQAPDEYSMVQEALDRSVKQGARTAGMTEYQYAQMKEAVVAYLKDPKKSGIRGEEASAIDGRRQELTSLLSAVGAM
ncbi:MAG TPA: hypothetical protein VG817_04835 [Gemmatimonadales bacterium]|nr:hypothetical protein [Gemmatimonadales bacterium]